MAENHTVRVIVDINVPSELEKSLLEDNTEFKQMAGMAVQAVAVNVGKASADPRWNNGRGYQVQVHQHFSTRDHYCETCADQVARDRINVPALSD
jgi:hypothetical protein